MRYFPLLSLLFSLLVTATPTVFAGNKHWPVEIFDVMDNQRLVIFLANEDIVASPQWQPIQGGPPLSIAAALEHTSRWIAQEPRLKGAKVHEIKLNRIHGYESDNRWYYLFQLRTHKGRKSSAHYVAVLFNGKVVPVIVEPASIK
ncbi:hypothetical protein MNBD_GAMMA13-1156 [hydrothermal vent metagenome]|uniref:PepSY domain-containing protein n=1 Tax=hydrothermal vent metagenome TaxID=652676 RepID=A0A3B0Z6F5_9ZZZZ